MCSVDVDHMCHVFFDCHYAKSCWQAAGLSFDMSQVSFAPEWLLSQLEILSHKESIKLATVLWGGMILA